MTKQYLSQNQSQPMQAKPQSTHHLPPEKSSASNLLELQNHIGNRAVQRLLAQRSGDGAFDLDDETASRINGARIGGQPLDSAVQAQMSESMGADFSGVRVHTDGEAHQLSKQLNAKAFTTGQDIFFRGGAYSPQSGSGQELLAHELTHVVQQSVGAVGGGSTMRVNAPGDQFEQEADAIASTIVGTTVTSIQRQEDEEKQMQDTLSSASSTIGLASSILSQGENSIMDDTPGIGVGYGAIGEALSRGGRGESVYESVGGGLTSALTSGLLHMAGPKQALKTVTGSDRLSGGAGLMGSALKFLGTVTGEKSSSEFGLNDAGEYVDLLSKAASPTELAKQGISEGFMGIYNLAQAGGKSIAEGSTDPFIGLNDKNLKGETGPVTQGYSMIANAVGSAVTGDDTEMNHISDKAHSGDLGALPKLGDKIGEDWGEMANRPGGLGASFQEMGDFIWTGASGKGGIKGAGKSIQNTAGEIWDWFAE